MVRLCLMCGVLWCCTLCLIIIVHSVCVPFCLCDLLLRRRGKKQFLLYNVLGKLSIVCEVTQWLTFHWSEKIIVTVHSDARSVYLCTNVVMSLDTPRRMATLCSCMVPRQWSHLPVACSPLPPILSSTTWTSSRYNHIFSEWRMPAQKSLCVIVISVYSSSALFTCVTRSLFALFQSLELHYINLSSLVELRQLANSLPHLSSFTISEDGNPITTHPLFHSLLLSLLPLTTINGVEPTAADQSRAQRLFGPVLSLTSSHQSVSMHTPTTYQYLLCCHVIMYRRSTGTTRPLSTSQSMSVSPVS